MRQVESSRIKKGPTKVSYSSSRLDLPSQVFRLWNSNLTSIITGTDYSTGGIFATFIFTIKNGVSSDYVSSARTPPSIHSSPALHPPRRVLLVMGLKFLNLCVGTSFASCEIVASFWFSSHSWDHNTAFRWTREGHENPDERHNKSIEFD